MNEPVGEIRFVGSPDGESVFIPAIGLKVGTFTQPAGGNHPALSHHVPLNIRGTYRPGECADFDPDKQYRVDKLGFQMCLATTLSDEMCKRKAVNRSGACVVHGGRLHPLDRLQQDTDEPETEVPLSRYQMFLVKQITVEDLDDEELMAFGFRKADNKIFKPKNIPREMVTAFTRAIFDRSLDKLKSSALQAANTLASIMVDPSVDASVRRLAAESILDRTVGKAPLLVSINSDKPWETVFAAIAAKPLPNGYIEGEVVEDDLTRPTLPPDVQAEKPS